MLRESRVGSGPVPGPFRFPVGQASACRLPRTGEDCRLTPALQKPRTKRPGLTGRRHGVWITLGGEHWVVDPAGVVGRRGRRHTQPETRGRDGASRLADDGSDQAAGRFDQGIPRGGPPPARSPSGSASGWPRPPSPPWPTARSSTSTARSRTARTAPDRLPRADQPGRRGARRAPALDRPRHGPGHPAALPRRPARLRPDHRHRLLLRRRPARLARSPRTTSRPSRPRWRRSSRTAEPFERFSLPAADARQFCEDLGQRLKVEHIDDELHKYGDPQLLPPGRVRRPLPGPAHPARRQGRGVQAALDRRRLLEGPHRRPDAPARLRHRLLRQEGPRRLPRPDRGGQEARPPQARQGAEPVHHLARWSARA